MCVGGMAGLGSAAPSAPQQAQPITSSAEQHIDVKHEHVGAKQLGARTCSRH